MTLYVTSKPTCNTRCGRRMKKGSFVSTFPSPAKVQAASTPNVGLHPLTQIDPDPATSPSNPVSASTRREPLSLNLETLSSIHGLRSEGHGAWPSDKGSGFRHDINKSIYDRPSVTAARTEHYTFPQSSNEHGNNSEHKKAASSLRRL